MRAYRDINAGNMSEKVRAERVEKLTAGMSNSGTPGDPKTKATDRDRIRQRKAQQVTR